jgi:lipoprotein-anchoring transpeptidase ErfK/SrfK/exonuclease VII small subunit
MRRAVATTAVVVAAAFIMIGVSGAMQPAAAQQGWGNFFGYQTTTKKKRRVRRKRRVTPQETAAAKQEAEKSKPKGPVYAVISLGDQRMSVYDSTGRIAQTRVSTGTRGHRTPKGVFSVIQRRRHHYSNLYNAAPMPWMQRITWSGVAMHAGHVPGYPASHGCIRLPYSFAPKMWRMSSMGSRVIVAPRSTEPYEIEHESLPLPTMHSQPAAVAQQQASAKPVAHVELASMGTPAHVPVATAPESLTESDEPRANSKLNPIAYAAALKEQAKADKAATKTAEKDALKAAQEAGEEARQAAKDLRKAEDELAKAEASLAKLEQRAEEADTSDADAETAEKAATRLTEARSEVARTRAAREVAEKREALASPAAFAAVKAWKRAVAASKDAARTLKEAERRSEPVSILISRKEGRIFIRQDWKSVYEAPVTIKEPDTALGTHVLIAVAAEDDGSAVRWSAITVPENADKDGKKKSSEASVEPKLILPVSKAAAESAPPPKPMQTAAAAALDRIEIPAEARQRMAELLWTGASLIISDHARSNEMGDYTDFIVQTR